MTPDHTAALIWAIGTAWFAWRMVSSKRSFLRRDPLLMCDDCRDQRRRGSVIFEALPASMMMFTAIVAAATWPVMIFVWVWHRLRKGRHRCDRAAAAR